MAEAKNSGHPARRNPEAQGQTATTPVERLQWLRQVQRDRSLTAIDSALAIVLQSFVNGKSGYAFPGNGTLAAELGVSERTIERRLAALIGAGHILQTKHRREPSRLYLLIQDPTDLSGQEQPKDRQECRVLTDQDPTNDAVRPDIPVVKTRQMTPSHIRKELSDKNSATELGAAASEARQSAPSSASSQAAGVDRLGVDASEIKNSPQLPDSSPSPAGSLTRLTARSPAEVEPFKGSEMARFESLDPGPAYEGLSLWRGRLWPDAQAPDETGLNEAGSQLCSCLGRNEQV
jgi:hypothetical protein